MSAADAIRENFNCLVAVVHHCGVSGDRPRGHTSLTGAIEAQIAVRKDEDGRVVASVEYMKDGPEGATELSTLEVVDIGTDDDGDPITSCVIRPSEGEVKHGPKKQTGATAIALDLLKRALVDAGEKPPASDHIPTAVKSVVPLNLWRSYCYAGTGTDRDNPESKRKAFNRAVTKLQEIKAVGVWDDLVWMVA